MAGVHSAIVELRRYELKPGMRDVLIELFDREFVESQEAVGMSLLGQFRDLDRPDQFVWLRGFPDMAARRRGLEAFYGGPVWKRHSEAANATMIDVSNVLLLRPARPGSAFELDTAARPSLGSAEPAATIVATILHVDGADPPDVVAPFFVDGAQPERLPGPAGARGRERRRRVRAGARGGSGGAGRPAPRRARGPAAGSDRALALALRRGPSPHRSAGPAMKGR
jgi:hypothetical protein